MQPLLVEPERLHLATLQELEQRTMVRGSKDSSLSAAIAVKQQEEVMDWQP